MSDHPHFCDCDDCLNAGGGMKLTSLPVVYRVPHDLPRRKRDWATPLRVGYASVTKLGLAVELRHRREGRDQARRRRAPQERTAAE